MRQSRFIMNINRNGKAKKRQIPRHGKRNIPSIYEILNAAGYKRRNKDLLQNNKRLAKLLEKAQCTIRSNNRIIQNLTENCNQVLLAKLKMSSMAKNIQKFMVDWDDVMQYLDISCINIPKLNVYENERIRIPEPNLEKIDESALSEEEEIQSRGKRSVTEDMTDEITTVEGTETTPQLNLIHNSGISEKFQNDNGKVGSLINSLCSPVNISATPVASEIPIRKNLFQKSDIRPPLYNKNNQETFMAAKFAGNEQLNQISATEKGDTFIITEIMCKETLTQNDKWGTFVVPPVPSLNISKPSHKIPLPAEGFRVDGKTDHFSEDMEQTEIIPSTQAGASDSLLNKNEQMQIENVILPPICKNKEVEKTEVSPSIVKMNEISPIAKVSMLLESNKEALETGIGKKLVDSKQPETISSKNKIDLELSFDDIFSCEPKAPVQVPSRKSVLPSKKLSKQKKSLVRDFFNNRKSLKLISENDLIRTNIFPKENIDASTLPQKTATSSIKSTEKVLDKCPEKYITTSYCASSDEISSDSDPDFRVESPVVVERKRIPGRKSLRPNRRKPFIITNSKSRKSIGRPKNIDLLSEIKEKCDFSSPHNEEESSKIIKTVQCENPKRSFKFRASIDKNAVAVLEKDANLKFQDQSRKKKSLKHRVSIVNLNTSPSKKDEKLDEPTEQLRVPRKSCLKRKSVLVSEKQCSSPILCHQNISGYEDLQEKKSAATVIDTSDKTKKTSSEESKVQEEAEINEKLKLICENPTNDKQNNASQYNNKFLAKNSEQEITMKSMQSTASQFYKTKKVFRFGKDFSSDYNLKENEQAKVVSSSTFSKSVNVDGQLENEEVQSNYKLLAKNTEQDMKLKSIESAASKCFKTKKGITFEKGLTADCNLKEKEIEQDKDVTSNTVLKSVNADGQLEYVTNSTTFVKPFKPRVRFASINTSPSKKDEKLNGYSEKLTTIQTGDKQIEVCCSRKSRKTLVVSEKQDLQEKQTAISNKSDMKISNKECKGQEKEINKKMKLIPENSTDDKQNKPSQPSDKLLAKTESAASEFFETEKTIFENLPAGSNLKKNVVEKKSEQDKIKVLSSSTVSKSINVHGQSDHVANTLTGEFKEDIEVKTDSVINSKKKRKNNSKPKQKAKICVLSELPPNKLNEENKLPQKIIRDTSPPPCKTRKTISAAAIESSDVKENLVIPELEKGGRSRRTRTNINFKEPSLNLKLRRVK